VITNTREGKIPLKLIFSKNLYNHNQDPRSNR
jgi:hypothetical protein